MALSAEKKSKIGLLGGTFDPVHNGHLAVAEHVLRTLGLDAIWFIPASRPPHKAGHGNGRQLTSFGHRFAMLQKAIAQNRSFVATDIEAKRSAPSYSIDTINILIRQIGAQADLFFIIGADAFLEINTWKRFKELPLLVSFVIISRPGFPPEQVEEAIRNIFAGYEYDPGHKAWSSPDSKGFFFLQHMEPVPISSTAIREMAARGEDISGLVPPAVEHYIRKHSLYASDKF